MPERGINLNFIESWKTNISGNELKLIMKSGNTIIIKGTNKVTNFLAHMRDYLIEEEVYVINT